MRFQKKQDFLFLNGEGQVGRDVSLRKSKTK